MSARPEVQVFSDRLALAWAAAEEFARQSKIAVSQRGRFVVCLAGGSTPLETYRLLASPPYSIELPWKRMVFLWGDERMVPPDDPESNYGQAQQALLQHVPVHPEQVRRIHGEIAADQAIADYVAQLRQFAAPRQAWPRFDLVLLGLGADGHIASLFPKQSGVIEAGTPVVAVRAEYASRPALRLTLTPAVFNDARRVLFLVAGAEKAAALSASLDPASEPFLWPARRIDPPHGQVVWLVDAKAYYPFPWSTESVQ
jgi:6-phosphogluconolactonase